MMAITKYVTALLLLLVSGVAAAHSGWHDSGLASGLLHPLSGIDHLLAMLLAGIWAAGSGDRRTMLLLPLAFVGSMGLGATFSVVGYSMPLMELGIAFSVLFLGMLLVTGRQLSPGVATVLVGGFALFHGAAHGAEIPSGQFALYFSGFIATTAMLNLAGMALGRRLLQRNGAMCTIGLFGSTVGLGLLLGA